MIKAVINESDDGRKVSASDYEVNIYRRDGLIDSEIYTQYTYSDLFEVIKEKYEGENNVPVNKITIELIR